jgi:hypothetical protein
MLSFSVQHIRRTARVNMPVFMSQRPVVAPAAQPQPSPRHEPRACRREAVAARRPYVAQGTGYPRWGSFPLMAGYGGRHPEFSRTTRIPVLAYIEWTAPRPAGFVACLVRSPAVFSGPTSRRWLWYIDICRIVRCNAKNTHCCCCNKLTTYGPGENQEMQKPTGWDTVPSATARTSIPAPCWDHGSARNQSWGTRPLAGQCRSFEHHHKGLYGALGLLASRFPCSPDHTRPAFFTDGGTVTTHTRPTARVSQCWNSSVPTTSACSDSSSNGPRGASSIIRRVFTRTQDDVKLWGSGIPLHCCKEHLSLDPVGTLHKATFRFNRPRVRARVRFTQGQMRDGERTWRRVSFSLSSR